MNKQFFENKTILITGGTGSLGKAIIKYLKKFNCKIVVFSRDEGKQALLFGRDSSIFRVIGDVRDFEKLNTTFSIHKPDYVIHTGALKRVDDMEFHPDECVKTNVKGSENVARASLLNNVKKCILVSTDKACQPTNVYGSSKFIAERIFTNYDYNSTSTVFASVRYGNVIASRGSFIPLWMGLLKNKQSIDVTSMSCTRFLFPLSEAVETVLGTLYYSQGGEVFIPKINSFKMKTVIKSIQKIMDLDKIDYHIRGMRPGEKIHEDMLAKTELDFTYKVTNKLLAVTPQYTNRTYTFKNKYKGLEFNSFLHTDDNVNNLVKLIKKGIKDGE